MMLVYYDVLWYIPNGCGGVMYKADKRFMNMIYITRVYHIHSEKIVCIVEKPTIFLILWPQGWSYVSYLRISGHKGGRKINVPIQKLLMATRVVVGLRMAVGWW